MKSNSIFHALLEWQAVNLRATVPFFEDLGVLWRSIVAQMPRMWLPVPSSRALRQSAVEALRGYSTDPVRTEIDHAPSSSSYAAIPGLARCPPA